MTPRNHNYGWIGGTIIFMVAGCASAFSVPPPFTSLLSSSSACSSADSSSAMAFHPAHQRRPISGSLSVAASTVDEGLIAIAQDDEDLFLTASVKQQREMSSLSGRKQAPAVTRSRNGRKVATTKRKTRLRHPKSLTSAPKEVIEATTSFAKKSFDKLLTKGEEGDLTRALRAMRAAVRIRDDLSLTSGQQPTEQEWADACGTSVDELRRIMHDGQEARTKLVNANGGLVNSLAKKYHYSLRRATSSSRSVGTILNFQDLIQEGNLGLMEAAERFEPERGFRFSTYATWWVKQRILRAIGEFSRVIRLPGHVNSMLQKMNKTRKRMEKEIGRVPSTAELAHCLGVPVDKIRMYQDASRHVLSLEVPVRNDSKDTRTLGEFISSDSLSPVEDAELESMRNDIREVVSGLGERERDVLFARFGLDDGDPKTIDQTAGRLGLSKDRVRLIEARALNKLRQPQCNYKLKAYVGETDPAEEEDDDDYFASKDLMAQLSPEQIWSF